MKKLVSVQEIEGEGLISLLGQRVTLFCLNYIYTGDLEGVNDTCVKLTNGGIVYETGELTAKEWQDYQSFGKDKPFYVQIDKIESFLVLR